jgi:hypothetical protein
LRKKKPDYRKKRTGAKEGVRKTVSVPAVMSAGTVLVYIVAI